MPRKPKSLAVTTVYVEELANLRSNSGMLGLIAKEVEPWCKLGNCNTLGGVQAALRELKTLRGHSQMLGQIAGYVSEWCAHDECTTLDAVRLVLADCRKYRGIAERLEIESKY